MKVVKEVKNTVVLRKEKSTLHSEESALGPLVLERIVVHLIISRACDKLEGFLFPKLFLSNVVAFSVT